MIRSFALLLALSALASACGAPTVVGGVGLLTGLPAEHGDRVVDAVSFHRLVARQRLIDISITQRPVEPGAVVELGEADWSRAGPVARAVRQARAGPGPPSPSVMT